MHFVTHFTIALISLVAIVLSCILFTNAIEFLGNKLKLDMPITYKSIKDNICGEIEELAKEYPGFAPWLDQFSTLKTNKIYQTLADDLITREHLHPIVDKTVSQQIEEILGPYLEQASHGDFSFFSQNPDSRSFTKNQREAFVEFAKHSQGLNRYRVAADKLNYATMVATKDGKLKFDVDSKSIDEFERFMEQSDDTASTLKYMDESPKSWIAHISLLRTRKALSVISQAFVIISISCSSFTIL